MRIAIGPKEALMTRRTTVDPERLAAVVLRRVEATFAKVICAGHCGRDRSGILKPEEFAQLIAQREGETLDFKQAMP